MVPEIWCATNRIFCHLGSFFVLFVLLQNPLLPSPFNNDLKASEGSSASPIIVEHLNAIANTRKAFVQAETSPKLHKALKHPLCSYCNNVFKQGHNIFYKLPQEKRW